MVCLFIKHLLSLCLSCLQLREGHYGAVEGAEWLAWISRRASWSWKTLAVLWGVGQGGTAYGIGPYSRCQRGGLLQLRLQVAQVLLGEMREALHGHCGEAALGM